MANSTGTIIRLLHSDDLLRPACLEWELKQFASYPKLQVLFQDCLPFHDESEIKWNESPLIRFVEPADYFRQFLSTMTALPSGLLFKREAYNEVGGMREDWCFLCDWEFFGKLLIRSFNRREFVAYAKAGNFAWRLHDQSTTSLKWKDHYIEHRLLMAQWKDEIGDPNHGYFVDGRDWQHFWTSGQAYRLKRLRDDYRNLPFKRRLSEFCWYANTCMESPDRQIAFKQIRNRFKRKLWSLIKPRTKVTNNVEASFQTAVTENKELAPDFCITPFHGDPSICTPTTSIVVPYDNSLNLWWMREKLAAARHIQINHVNLNRFFVTTLHETLKFIQPDSEVCFHFHDNQHMTWFGLKAIINYIAPGRFEFVRQNQTPLEGTKKGHSEWKIVYRCTAVRYRHDDEELNGCTIGILTLGDRPKELDSLIASVRSHCKHPYEIVLVVPKNLPDLQNHPDIRQIVFAERDDFGWITKKKNLICQEAKYSDIFICHDRFVFADDFFPMLQRWGTAYSIAAPRVVLEDGRRALDWGVVQGKNYTWCKGGLISYRDYSSASYVPGGVTMIRKSFWERHPWCEDIFWNEHEDVELCRRIQNSGGRIYFFPGTMTTSRDRWVEHNPLLEFSDKLDHI